MTTSIATTPRGRIGFGATERRDNWWAGPVATAIGLGIFIVYGTFRAFYNADYVVDNAVSAHLLSPFYSPLIVWPDMPSWFSPAFLILWAPGGFRVTCYYYRKAYYRAYFLDPPACAVGEPRGTNYKGETRLLLFQNLHRYFMYLALIFIVILTIDVILACIWPVAGGGHTFGVSVGTIVLALNTTLLAGYTFGCHSFRHLVGGKLDCFSCPLSKARHKAWKGVSVLNKRHMLFAWTSLFMVGFADFYIWMVASGTITDFRIF